MLSTVGLSDSDLRAWMLPAFPRILWHVQCELFQRAAGSQDLSLAREWEPKVELPFAVVLCCFNGVCRH